MNIEQLAIAFGVPVEMLLGICAVVVLLALVGVVYEVAGIASDIMTTWSEH